MEQIKNLVKMFWGYGGHAVAFISHNAGLRPLNAPPLPIEQRRVLRRRLRLLLTSYLLIALAYGALFWTLIKTVESLLKSDELGVEVEMLWSRWTWQFYASAGLMLISVSVFAWSLAIRRRFQSNLIFSVPALILLAATMLWQPAARMVVNDKILSLFRLGETIWKSSEWDHCYTYYDRLFRVFPKTIIADNCQGRMAGCDYHKGNYIKAIQRYAALLRNYPDTDIQANVVFSLRSAIRCLWNVTREPDLPTCIRVYREANLASAGFSVYEYFLDAPTLGEAARPKEFGSASDTERELYQTLMREFPNDKWTDRIAFFVGDEAMLRTKFPNSRYNLTAGVIRGWRLHRMQDYSQAAELYVEFLKQRPPDAEAASVRHLLTLCYFATDDLGMAFTNLQSIAGTDFSVPPTEHYLWLSRFAYMQSSLQMQQLFQSLHQRLPTELSADMAAILAERLELEGGVSSNIVSLRSYARRSMMLTRGVATEDQLFDRVSSSLLDLPAEDDLAKYANSRWKQTSTDNQYEHYLDRNYSTQKQNWPESQGVSYTTMLNARVQRSVEAKLEAITNNHSQALELGVSMLTTLKEVSVVKPAVSNLLNRMRVAGCVLVRSDLKNLYRISKALDSQALEELALQSLRHNLAAKACGLEELIRFSDEMLESFPTATKQQLEAELQAWAASTTNLPVLLDGAKILDRSLRRAKYRTQLAKIIVPTLLDCYERCQPVISKHEAGDFELRLAELCLQNRETYQLSRCILDSYIRRFPQSDFRANCHLWLAWLWCCEASQNNDIRSIYEACYRQALTNYEAIISQTRQERVDLISRNSSRKIRLKLAKVASGEKSPASFDIPPEIRRYAMPTTDLEKGTWVIHCSSYALRTFDERSSQKYEMNFYGDRVVTDVVGAKIRMPLRTWFQGEKVFFKARIPPTDGTGYLIKGSITGELLNGLILKIDSEARLVEAKYFVGQLLRE